MLRKVLSWICIVLAVACAAACVDVGYQRAGHTITPRAGQTLVFGRVRFFLDDVEFFPWKPALLPEPAWRTIERHLWLLRLGKRAVSAEIHPDPDGSLAIWLASGDYALVGSTEIPGAEPPDYEVVGLIRVPLGPTAAYAGQLIFRTEHHEGGFVSRSDFGLASAVILPIVEASADLEHRLGTLPEPPVISAWCAGEELPRLNDPDLTTRAREILDRGCPGPSGHRGVTP